MKVIGINGSPRINGNTGTALKIIQKAFSEHNIDMEIITVGNETIKGCNGCARCIKAGSGECLQIPNDMVNVALKKIREADGVVFGSPVYYSGMNGTFKSFMDRVFYAGGTNKTFRHKIGACITAVRRTGGSETFFDMMKYLTYSEMMIPASSYWNVVHGTEPGDVLKDAEGVHTMETLADNMAYMIKVFKETEVKEPAEREKVWTSFIR